MPAELIDGRAIAKKVRDEVAVRAKTLTDKGIKPGLAVVLVGEDPASVVYTTSKAKAAEEAGMFSLNIKLPADTTQAELIRRIDELNSNPNVHGILVQMPLPKQIDPDTVIRRIDPAKDVDGFHPVNVGKMLVGERDGFIPCTPAGIQVLLKESGVKTPGKDCVIIGRSNIVGKPMAALMVQDNENANCTVTVCHRHTADLKSHTRRADILIVAAGRARMVSGEMVKPGAVVIDVGTNRIADPQTKSGTRLVGDVEFESVRAVASKITPVPGGVGPMTIAMLMSNTVRAAEMRLR
ncbi:MAG TPA: bifunctional 5,10-methylenetetrahydrofolate dehydrogenase/5,10-methenyltetrahydrofolate cyclohydrolase [Gemmatimonadaceae bacterium]|nr:bifunctional 5,10-methylenetetrahydrofolate dehydrogenase/5,10-methenyltetrahydrofolate cyclohydrolase [Gemmatimonadaceae bacterium]